MEDQKRRREECVPAGDNAIEGGVHGTTCREEQVWEDMEIEKGSVRDELRGETVVLES